MTQRNDKTLRLGTARARHDATVYIPAAINSAPGHGDPSQASHVTQNRLVHSCQLSSSACVL